MSRKTVRLTVDHLAMLPEPERSCLFWEMGPVERAGIAAAERAGEKEAWLSTVLREWGSCGRVVLHDGDVAGYALYAPAAWLPGSATLPTSPSSPDAILLATVWVEPAHRGGGLGRVLVQSAAADLVARGHTALESYGDTRAARAGAGAGGCVVPAEFLSSVGFNTQRTHPTTPRMRMELRSAVRWKDEVEQALEKVWGAVRLPAPKATRPIGGPARAASPERLG